MLIYRVLSAIVGIPLLLVLVAARGGAPFAIAIGLLAVIGAHEFCRGVRQYGANPQEWLAWLGCAGLIAVARDTWSYVMYLPFVVPLFLMLGLITELFRRDRAPIRNLGATVLAVLYVGWLFTFLVLLRQTPGSAEISLSAGSLSGWFDLQSLGVWLVLFAFFTTWACDTGAYSAGRTLGKHKLAPSLSPGKTIEGAIGGVVGSVIVAALVGGVLAFPMWARLLLGLAVGVFCLLGDLTESAMKREIGIKDFGSLIPGHGGVLDRFDSLLFVGPTVYYLVNLMGLVK